MPNQQVALTASQQANAARVTEQSVGTTRGAAAALLASHQSDLMPQFNGAFADMHNMVIMSLQQDIKVIVENMDKMAQLVGRNGVLQQDVQALHAQESKALVAAGMAGILNQHSQPA